MSWLFILVTPAVLSQAKALWLALISTGNVIKLNMVVRAKRPIPIQIRVGNVCMKIIPARIIHVTHDEAKLTTGTRAERIFNGP